ncbi:MAG: acyltransferase family protein [Acidimicrobiia bacterium]
MAVTAQTTAAPTEQAAAPAPGRRIPALDGLRGFALVGMLLWHAEVTWVQGGFVRMTIFFALSGYLAARSWGRIRERTGGRGGFATFWWRRARRLLPLSYLGVAIAVAVTAAVGTADMRERLGGDVLSVLAYVSNLRFWLSGQGYGELFTEPSLLQHYWTLSIEEQAFALLPLLLAGVSLLAGRGRLRRQAALVGAITVAAVGLPLVVHHDADAVWYSSPIRIGEFCGGVALALWMGAGREDRFDRRLVPVGLASLAVVVGAVLLVPRDAAWLSQGGMGLFLVPTLGLLAAAARAQGPAASALSWRPLVAMGRWTFSIYVVHWPLFFVLDRARTGLGGWELATLRVGAAVAIGALLHVLVERPLMASAHVEDVATGLAGPARRRLALDRLARAWVPAGWWRTRPAGAALASGAAALAVVGFLPSGEDPYRWERVDDQSVAFAEMRMFEPDEGDVRVAVFGGSTAVLLDVGGEDWLRASDDLAVVPGVSKLGCGFVREGRRIIRWDDQTWEPTVDRPAADCTNWPETWPYVAQLGEADVALVVIGAWDTLDFELDGIGSTHVGEPAFDRVLDEHLQLALDRFRTAGVEQVQLATTPVVGPGASGRARELRGLGDDHEARVAAFNDVLRRFADRHDDVAVVEYGAHVDALGDERSAEWLPDGVHPTEEAAARLWADFLGAAVVEAFAEG